MELESAVRSVSLTLHPPGNRAVVQVFEGTSGIDVKKVQPHRDGGDEEHGLI